MYQAPARCIAYTLQWVFKEELDWQQIQQVIGTLVDLTSEWYNNFVLVPKPNGKVRQCLDSAIWNQVLVRPFHRGLTVNNILPRPAYDY